MKAMKHAAIISTNVSAFLNKTGNLKHYKTGAEMIVVSLGKVSSLPSKINSCLSVSRVAVWHILASFGALFLDIGLPDLSNRRPS